MKLIFVTRKVDKKDTRAGFVFDWIVTLSKKLDRLIVVCQEKGDAGKLPSNVAVYSFGKDRGSGRLRQGADLFRLIFSLSKQTDGVLVHMMPIYAIVSWLPAKLRRNKIVLWYTHKSIDLKLRLAHLLVDRVLTASRESFRLNSRKVSIVGHGIPIWKFDSQEKYSRQKNKSLALLSVGRISRVKDYETLIKAVEILVNHKKLTNITLNIYGDPATEADIAYQQTLSQFAKEAELQNNIVFQGGVPYEKVPGLYQEADVFINLSQTGSLDKTVLEAAASRVLSMTSNEAFENEIVSISKLLFFERNNPQDLARKIVDVWELPEKEKQAIKEKLFAWVSTKHNLEALSERIISNF